VAVDGQRFSGLEGIERRFDFITVARLAPIKRLHLLIEAIALVARQRPVTLAIVGDGPELPALQALAQRLGVARHVTFCGWQENVEAWVASAGFFVLTSRSEGLPISLLEAMSAGVPGIVPRVGDVPDVVDSGRNGFSVEGQAAQDYAAVLTAALTLAPADRQRMADAARAAAVSYHVPARAAAWRPLLQRWSAAASHAFAQGSGT
jgi:glycosyltransferase involved in cell wall biosynthesis